MVLYFRTFLFVLKNQEILHTLNVGIINCVIEKWKFMLHIFLKKSTFQNLFIPNYRKYFVFCFFLNLSKIKTW